MKFRKVMAWVLLMMMAVSFAHGEEEAAPVPPFGDFSEKYSDLFLAPGQEAVQGELYYYSENIFLEITPLRELRSDIYIADIYVRSVENFQRAFGKDKWNSYTEKVLTISQNNDAVLGMTGDNGHNLDVGWLVGNGKQLR